MLFTPKVIIDTRESRPWEFASKNWRRSKNDNSVVWEEVRKKLDVGDYAIEFDGHLMDHLMVIERKSLPDFINCIMGQRDRFFAELERGKDIRRIYLLIEGNVEDIVKGNMAPFCKKPLSPNTVFGSLLGIERQFTNVRAYWCGKKEYANAFAEYILRHWWHAILRNYGKTERQKEVCPYLEDPLIACKDCTFYDKEIEGNCKMIYYGEI